MSRDDASLSLGASSPAESVDEFAAWLEWRPNCEWVDQVRRDQSDRWRSGQGILLEDYLRCRPELTHREEDVLVLIVGEILLRRKLGHEPNLEEYQRRFPHLAGQISVQFHLDRLWTDGQASTALRVACPACRHEFERPDETVADDLVCPSCGSGFRRERDLALNWHADHERRKLGKYELIEPVGIGAFGVVYKARDTKLGRVVAIKVPRAMQLAAKDDLQRFLREARSVAQLRHPSIVSVHEINQSGETPYLVSEFVQGTTLAEQLASRRPAAREAADLLAAVADALHYAHEMGVIHRDVKPANVMLDEKGTPRLMDFGLARRAGGEATMTVDGQVLGTPAYMSPEQARGESHNVDGRSDVYSLGAILYQLLTGELPFGGTTQMLLHQVLHDEPRRPGSVSDSVPRDLETICLKAMAKEAARRYATARDMADDLRRFLTGEPIHARPAGSAERLWRWSRRKPALASLSAAVGIQLMAISNGGSVAAILFRIQAKDATGELYFSRIAQANFVLTASSPNPGRAEDLLNACPQDRRNWEWHYLKRLWRIEPVTLSAEGSREFNGIAFSHDGRHLAAACGDGKVRVWDQETGEMVVLRGHDGFAFSVAFSPGDSGRLASAGSDGRVRVWDLASRGEMLPPLSGQKPKQPNGMAYSVAFSPDGKLLAAASEGETVQVWNAATGRSEHALTGHEISASCVAFSPDGPLLATGSWRGVVRLWDARSGRFLRQLQLPEHIQPVGCLAFSPDAAGQYLAAGYFGRQLDVWDTANGKIHRRLRGHTDIVTGLAFHPQDAGRLASSGADRSVRIWDVSGERKALQLQDHTDVCSALAFSPDGLSLASASADKRIRVWDATPLAGNERQERFTLPFDHDVWSVAVSPDGTLLAAAGLGPNVRLWDAASGRVSRTIENQFMEAVFSLAFSPDSAHLAAAGIDGDAHYVVKVLDVQTGQLVLEHREPEAAIFAVALSPDGRWMAMGLQGGLVKLADVQTGKVIYSGTHDRPIAMGGVTFGHDGSRLSSVSRDGTVVVWDVPTAASAAPQAGAPAVPFIATESGGLRTIWSQKTGTAFWSVAFSPDGRQLVTGSKDGQVTLWDAEAGRKISRVQRATRGENLSATFSPDGRWILSASEDCTVRVLDATTLERVHTFRGHLGPIRCVVVSPAKEFMVTGSIDKSVNLWDLKQLDKTLEN